MASLPKQLAPGRPFPRGATWDGNGANFALFSEHAEKVELCLFSSDGKRETARFELSERTQDIWHGYLADIKPGQLYGYRVYGAYAPEDGHRFNGHKLLIDPYAKALSGRVIHHDSNYAFDVTSPLKDKSFDTRDNAAYMPKAVLVDHQATPVCTNHLFTPWSQTVIYELHVAGMTRRHAGVPEGLRGTFAGLSSDTMLRHFQDLGITAVELLPIYPFSDEPHLVDKGLTNYWGYSPYTFFATDPRYQSDSGNHSEFEAMVDRFHDANIEVYLDVVYNHTVEGGHMGPTLSLRGIDNLSYYRHLPSDPSVYINDTGCGNTLNLSHPRVLQMVMDSLRHWVNRGVDGFRFDLASALARTDEGFSQHSGFLSAINQDPMLAGSKMIAEPWDLGPGGYQLGNFPRRWAEWNDCYRNTLRAFWRGDDGVINELAHRISGSQNIFAASRRPPQAGINFITAHDGFCLEDLVSYNTKHNEANGEENRDGCGENYSNNHGVEGPTSDKDVTALRMRQKRNLIASLFLSQGVPMMLGGDELGRSQQGNNNAYCQDNEISWLDWSDVDQDQDKKDFLSFVKTLIHFRTHCPAFRRKDFFDGHPVDDGTLKDITWWSAKGREMVDKDWHIANSHCLGFHIADCGTENKKAKSNLLVLMNAGEMDIDFHLPPAVYGKTWHRMIDSGFTMDSLPNDKIKAGSVFELPAKTLVLLSTRSMAPGDMA